MNQEKLERKKKKKKTKPNMLKIEGGIDRQKRQQQNQMYNSIKI
jgi:hypothetical protein